MSAKPVWVPTTIRIRGQFDEGGSRVVQGYTSASIPGLAVTPTQGEMRYFGAWTLTHLRSGRRVASPMHTPTAAKRLAAKLGPLGDWTKTTAQIRRSKKFVAAVKQFYSDEVAAHIGFRKPLAAAGSRPGDEQP